MSQPQKKRSTRRAAASSSGSTAAPAVDQELTRLAVEALPESQRRRWERQQRSEAAERAGRIDGGADEGSTAEALAEEISVSARNSDPTADTTPVWYRIIMFGLILVGLLWLILWYLLDFSYPVPGIGYWNVAVGIGLMMVGLIMTTRWR